MNLDFSSSSSSRFGTLVVARSSLQDHYWRPSTIFVKHPPCLAHCSIQSKSSSSIGAPSSKFTSSVVFCWVESSNAASTLCVPSKSIHRSFQPPPIPELFASRFQPTSPDSSSIFNSSHILHAWVKLPRSNLLSHLLVMWVTLLLPFLFSQARTVSHFGAFWWVFDWVLGMPIKY